MSLSFVEIDGFKQKHWWKKGYIVNICQLNTKIQTAYFLIKNNLQRNRHMQRKDLKST